MEKYFINCTVPEKAKIRRIILKNIDEDMNTIVNETVKFVGKIERREDSRTKKRNLKAMLKDDETVRGFPIVFWICSKHSNAAEGHARLQGRLYYDRFWYSKLARAGAQEWILEKTEQYIKKNKLVSVQYIQGPPNYLCTRPYCKHRFEPVDLLTVLTVNIKNIEAKAPKTYGRNVKRGEAYDFIKHGIGLDE